MANSSYSASLYDSATLGVYARSSSLIYQRDVINVLNASLQDASNIGTLKTNETQLDVTGQLSKANSDHYYKFTLDGDSLKVNFKNNTNSSALRVQIMDADGKVVADSSSRASSALQAAYASASSSKGLNLESGDYYVKVTFDATSLRSIDQTYSLGLYSGDRFGVSYQTTGKSQTKPSQTVTYDNTMTYSLIDALEYSTKATHLANETSSSAINVGWIFKDKSALSVKGQMTSVCDEQYYSFTLQQGEDLKFAFNNKTGTSELRVQLYDSTGSKLLADSHGTEKQRKAYASLVSSDGLAAKAGNYVVKVSYASGAAKKDQTYSLNIYSGTVYDALYETVTTTETAATAILAGHLTDSTDPRTVSATYLASALGEDLDDVFSVLNSYTGYI